MAVAGADRSGAARPGGDDLAVGAEVTVEVGAVAHGGHCVARHEGRVLFVRDALPGERVRARITSVGRKGRFVRASAVEVLVASPDRRPAPCPIAGVCGGCDWQHATWPASRRLKEQVVRESLYRFAGVELPTSFRVRTVWFPDEMDRSAPDDERREIGLGWRTRGTLSVDEHGRAGFLSARSHDVVAAPGCPQLHSGLEPLDLLARQWPSGSRVRFVAPPDGPPLAQVVGEPVAGPIQQVAAGRRWWVATDGFWQVHPGAADELVDQVARMLDPRAGERLVDLYAGVGLFGLSLRDVADGDLGVTLVEADRRATELAEVNDESGGARVVRAPVERWVGGAGRGTRADLVVLDPPRVGAGRAVVQAVAGWGARAVAYVACDPVALARDVATFQESGYELAELVGLDLFPTTHHVECVAALVPRR